MARVRLHFTVGPTQIEDKLVVHLFSCGTFVFKGNLTLASSKRSEAGFSHLTVGSVTLRGGSGPREGPEVKPSKAW